MTVPTTATPTLEPPTTTTSSMVLAPLESPGNASADLETGLVAEWYDFEAGTRSVSAIDKYVSHWGKKLDRLAIRWTGLLRIETPGQYRFGLTVLGSCDLVIDGKPLLNMHSSPEEAASHEPVKDATPRLQVAAGDHQLVIRYSEDQGMAGIKFEYEGPDNHNLMGVVPRSKLLHPRGPCSLRDIPRVLSPPCTAPAGAPRWALDDGERCTPRCEAGHFPGGLNSSLSEDVAAAAATCKKGLIVPSDFACEPLRCRSPLVSNGGHPSCKEGQWIRSGEPCTPRCLAGYSPRTWGVLECFNGTLAGSFHCVSIEACDAGPSSELARHHDTEPCDGKDDTVLHSATCVAQCAVGYRATTNLTCNAGRFEPPDFECVGGNNSRGSMMLGTAAKGTAKFASSHPWAVWALVAPLLLACCCCWLVLCGVGVSHAEVRPKKRAKRGIAAADVGAVSSESEGDALSAEDAPYPEPPSSERGLRSAGHHGHHGGQSAERTRILQSSWQPLGPGPQAGHRPGDDGWDASRLDESSIWPGQAREAFMHGARTHQPGMHQNAPSAPWGGFRMH